MSTIQTFAITTFLIGITLGPLLDHFIKKVKDLPNKESDNSIQGEPIQPSPEPVVPEAEVPENESVALDHTVTAMKTLALKGQDDDNTEEEPPEEPVAT